MEKRVQGGEPTSGGQRSHSYLRRHVLSQNSDLHTHPSEKEHIVLEVGMLRKEPCWHSGPQINGEEPTP